MDLHDGDEGCIEVVGFWLLGVKDLDRIRASGDGEDGTSKEVFGELLSIKSGRSYNEFEVRTTLDSLYV